ncbi:MAG: PmoA family protein [Bacteroidia bacterium]|nr:PmoA family protein [Bacteroidia bacterium]
MRTAKCFFTCWRWISTIFLLPAFFLASGMNLNTQSVKDKGVKLVRVDDKQKVDVFINGNLFTSYQYPEKIEKPFLLPVIAPNGSVITRGFPIEPRKGERIDHPHHIGIWFNHGNVNGLDFWNNSSAIPADKKKSYGHIVHQKIVKAESGKKGVLEVVMNWDDDKGNTLLRENTKYIFSGDRNSRTIDHIATLTAVNGPVSIGESKEGLFAIRVDRAFEMPSNESLIFTDDKGNPTTVKATDNTGVTGMYTSSKGIKGDEVWGTRNDWVILSGVKDNVLITFGIFDHPKNPGYPAYAHARGYGLFSVNNFGQNVYDPKQEKKSFKLEKGESITLFHRFYVQSGSELTPEQANKIFQEFSKEY